MEKEIKGTKKVLKEEEDNLQEKSDKLVEKKTVIETSSNELNQAREKRDKLQSSRKYVLFST